MTTTTRNVSDGEALLRKRFDGWEYGTQWHVALDEALAAERAAGRAEMEAECVERGHLTAPDLAALEAAASRATVERIRERLHIEHVRSEEFEPPSFCQGCILDEEAAR